MPRITTSRRHTQGRAHLAQILGFWCGRAHLSYNQLGAIADWATGEEGILISSQITHLRKARLLNPNWRLVEALAEANEAIWRWQTEGHDVAIKMYGPIKNKLVTATTMDDAIWLPKPDSDNPLSFCDWCLIFVGRLTLDYVNDFRVSKGEGPQLSEELAAYLDHFISTLGVPYREGLQLMRKAWPADQEPSLQRVLSLLAGSITLTSDQLEDDIKTIASAISALSGHDRITPSKLYGEITAARRRF